MDYRETTGRDRVAGLVPLHRPNSDQTTLHAPSGELQGRAATYIKALTAAKVVNKICRLLLDAPSLMILGKNGFLQAEFIFKNGPRDFVLPLPRVCKELAEAGEISMETAALIQDVLKKLINPSYIGLHPEEVNGRQILGRITMAVSECRQIWHMDHEGTATHEDAISLTHRHSLGVNSKQDRLHHAEEAFRQQTISQEKIESIARQIFGPNTRYSRVISTEKSQRFCLRLVFNSSLYGRNSAPVPEGKAIIENVLCVNLAEITALFKLIQERYLGIRPACHYIVNREVKPDQFITTSENHRWGIKTDFVPLIADYLIE